MRSTSRRSTRLGNRGGVSDWPPRDAPTHQRALMRSSGVRPRIPGMLPAEVADFGDEVRRIFLEISQTLTSNVAPGECSPALDVYEREDTIEIVADLPGVASSAVRVLARGDTILIA